MSLATIRRSYLLMRFSALTYVGAAPTQPVVASGWAGEAEVGWAQQHRSTTTGF